MIKGVLTICEVLKNPCAITKRSLASKRTVEDACPYGLCVAISLVAEADEQCSPLRCVDEMRLPLEGKLPRERVMRCSRHGRRWLVGKITALRTYTSSLGARHIVGRGGGRAMLAPTGLCDAARTGRRGADPYGFVRCRVVGRGGGRAMFAPTGLCVTARLVGEADDRWSPLRFAHCRIVGRGCGRAMLAPTVGALPRGWQICLLHRAKGGEGGVKAAHLVDQAAGDGLVAVDDRADVGREHIGHHHQLLKAFLFDP